VEELFFALYLCWLVVQFSVAVVGVGLLFPANLFELVWLGHDRGIVLLAFAASFLIMQGWGMVSQLGEAVRKTVMIQATAVLVSMTHLLLVTTAIFGQWLSLQIVLWFYVLEYAVLALVLGPKLISANLNKQPDEREDQKAVLREFVTYCKPLVVYGLIGFFYTFVDRWLLQRFGGSIQQGYFAVGRQFSSICLIATTSILKVFWKEIAEARERRDDQRVKMLYSSTCRGLYFASAWISCLVIPYSREILNWTVGPDYEAAWMILGLMFLYPIHQSLGQIGGAFFFATGQTRDYAGIGLIMMAVSIPVTYFMLASPSSVVPGLGLAAVGLAVKMVILQVIWVNLQTYVIARNNGWAYEYGYQVTLLTVLLGLGWIGKWSAGHMLDLIGLPSGQVVVALAGSALYAGVCMAMLYQQPSIAGLTGEQIRDGASAVTRWLSP